MWLLRRMCVSCEFPCVTLSHVEVAGVLWAIPASVLTGAGIDQGLFVSGFGSHILLQRPLCSAVLGPLVREQAAGVPGHIPSVPFGRMECLGLSVLLRKRRPQLSS